MQILRNEGLHVLTLLVIFLEWSDEVELRRWVAYVKCIGTSRNIYNILGGEAEGQN
jgi:hypothetical protein